MYRTSSNEHNVALIFSKDVDFDESIVDKSSAEFSEFFLGEDHVGTHSQAGETDVEVVKEEIRESMYVVKLLEMINTVLEYEAHLFSPSELERLNRIKVVNRVPQFLISRLVQRKRGKWHRADHLLSSYKLDLIKYMNIPEVDVPRELAQALTELCTDWGTQTRSFCDAPEDKEVIDLTLDSDEDEASNVAPKNEPLAADLSSDYTPPGAPTGEDFEPCSFADGTDSATPTQLLECLSLDELKLVAKRFKVSSKKQTRSELVKAILHSSSTQTTLPFTVVTKPSAKTLQKDKDDMRQFFQTKPQAKNMRLEERRVRNLCTEKFGACFRLHDEVFRVLHLVSLVYFRSTQYSESESILLSAILATTKKRNYPKYEYRRTAEVFKTRADMLRYTESLQLLGEIDILLGEGPSGLSSGVKYDRQEAAQEVIERWKSIWDRWNSLVTYFKDKPPCDRGLERFEDGHILTRVVYKAAYCFSLLKNYGMELKLYSALIRQTRWRRGRRGGWYDRMALIYTRYMGGGDANLNQARDILLEGLSDKLVHLGSRPKLLKRLRALEKKLRTPVEEQYAGDIELSTATLTRIEGNRVFTPLPISQTGRASTAPIPMDIKDALSNAQISGTGDVKPQRTQWKGKTIWKGKEGEVNVEMLALEYYEDLGFKGFHSEGSIISTLFGLLFWDILFAPIPGAFETPYQSAPLDLFHDSFVSAREDLIKARLAELIEVEGAAQQIIRAVDERERDNETWCVGVRWDQFEQEVLLEIVDCLGGRALATICRLLAEEYGNRGGGVPDLFVWNAAEKTCKFVEVKGPGDNLSETQKVWIDVLLGAGVDVEVCRVYEEGKMPALRPKKAKNKPRGRVARKGRVSKAKDKPDDSDEEQEPDLAQGQDEEGEPWSSSEDGDDTTEPEGRNTREEQPTSLQESGGTQLPSGPTHDIEHRELPAEHLENRNPPHSSSPAPTDTGSHGKRRAPEAELDGHQGINQTTKRGKVDKHHGMPPPPRWHVPDPRLGQGPPKTPTRADRAHTPTSRPGPSMPASAPPFAQGKIKAEPLSPTRPTLIASSMIGNERIDGDRLTRETVVPETPPPPARQERQAGSSSCKSGSTRTSKQWRDELKATPIRKRQKEKNLLPELPIQVEPTPKRKRSGSSTHIPAPASTSTSVAEPVAATTPVKPDPRGPNSKESSIAESRTPRKRTRVSGERVGLAASPSDWEKKWPEVFPKWVGDMAGDDSDVDYEPSQSQPESQ